MEILEAAGAKGSSLGRRSDAEALRRPRGDTTEKEKKKRVVRGDTGGAAQSDGTPTVNKCYQIKVIGLK